MEKARRQRDSELEREKGGAKIQRERERERWAKVQRSKREREGGNGRERLKKEGGKSREAREKYRQMDRIEVLEDESTQYLCWTEQDIMGNFICSSRQFGQVYRNGKKPSNEG